MKRTASKVDANQPEIVLALQGLGCTVQSLAVIGRGCPDLLVGVPTETGLSLNLLVEVKAHKSGTLAGEPNEEQRRWADEWRGQKPVVIRNVVDAGRLVKNVRMWADTMREGLTQDLRAG